MQESDRTHVGEVIRELSAVHRVKFDAIFAKAYWVALQDMSLADFDAAAEKLRKCSRFMPKPSEFYDAARIQWL